MKITDKNGAPLSKKGWFTFVLSAAAITSPLAYLTITGTSTLVVEAWLLSMF